MFAFVSISVNAADTLEQPAMKVNVSITLTDNTGYPRSTSALVKMLTFPPTFMLRTKTETTVVTKTVALLVERGLNPNIVLTGAGRVITGVVPNIRRRKRGTRKPTISEQNVLFGVNNVPNGPTA